MNSRYRLFVVSLILAVGAQPGSCGENRARTTLSCPCLPATAPITVDGRLTPDEWGHTVEIAGFTVSGSDTLAPEPVLMRLAYDRKHLYLGITCLESNMKGLKTGGAGGYDGAFWLDDSVEFFLDTNHDHETYTQFAVTAKGIRYDNRQGDSTWNADWTAATALGPDRWTAEIAVVFTGLVPSPPVPGDLWGFNLCRERQAGGHLELYNWANVERVFKNVELFGHIVFLPSNWKATPEAVLDPLRRAEGEESRLLVEYGTWSMRQGRAPVFTSFLDQLRREDSACPPFITKLGVIYKESPNLPYARQYGELAGEYAAIRRIIAGKRPLKAVLFDRHAKRLKDLRVESENLFWRVKLAELNDAMRQ